MLMSIDKINRSLQNIYFDLQRKGSEIDIYNTQSQSPLNHIFDVEEKNKNCSHIQNKIIQVLDLEDDNSFLSYLNSLEKELNYCYMKIQAI